MIEEIKNKVKILMAGNNDGHGFDHVLRVYQLAVKIAEQEKADVDIVAMAALLHDADDYKLFGEENAQNLSNARKIMSEVGVDADVVEKVCQIIGSMGYSKALKGIRPQCLEGKIVSDADMLDAIGALGVIRTLAFALERCDAASDKIFDPLVFPDLNLTAAEYKNSHRKSDNFINHFFEKLFKLKNMMFTSTALKMAEKRHEFMKNFLLEFFEESSCPEWIEYLQDYEKQSKVA